MTQNNIQVQGNSLTITLEDFVLTINIEKKPEPEVKHRYGAGRTMFDLVLEAARRTAGLLGDEEFTAADLYHKARELHPEMDLRRNSWNSHVMSCAHNHPSYKHYTSHRDYFRYHGRGKYTLKPEWRE